MNRLFLAAALLASAAAAQAQDGAAPPRLAPGNYYLYARISAASMQRLAVVKVAELKPGEAPLSVLDGGPGAGGLKLADIKLDAGKLTMTVAAPGAGELDFAGAVSPDGKAAFGSLARDGNVFRAGLEATAKDKLAKEDVVAPPKAPEAFLKKRNEITAAAADLGRKLQAASGGERAKLQAEFAQARKEAEAKFGQLYRETIPALGGDPIAVEFAEAALSKADAYGLAPEDIKTLVGVIDADAKKYGPRFEALAAGRLATTLAGQTGTAALAVPYAERAASAPGLAPRAKAQALKVLVVALEKSGKADALPKVRDELEALEVGLDAEYEKGLPEIKPEPYKGRADAKANKVAVVELFTGAQCPPCAPADVGFDALSKAYPAKDVVLLQYHLPIPGPDPLTNPDGEARFESYGKLFEAEFGGTPTVAINGKPGPQVGGRSMADAKPAFDALAEALGDELAKSSAVTITGSVTGTDTMLAVKVKLDGVKDLKETVKLYVVLAEETVRYPGGNGIRLHHHVVRGFANGASGTLVSTLANGEFAATVDVAKLRADLAAYLVKSNAERPFPSLDRPLGLVKLHAVVLVQDEKTGEILQAAELGGGK